MECQWMIGLVVLQIKRPTLLLHHHQLLEMAALVTNLTGCQSASQAKLVILSSRLYRVLFWVIFPFPFEIFTEVATAPVIVAQEQIQVYLQILKTLIRTDLLQILPV